jgi:hypothetical protein
VDKPAQVSYDSKVFLDDVGITVDADSVHVSRGVVSLKDVPDVGVASDVVSEDDTSVG